ncbi:MAG: hydrogenase small subunit [Thermoplasmata archaeon]
MQPISVIWLEGQGCTGCTISLTNSSMPAIADVLTGIIDAIADINLVFHPAVMLPWGGKAIDVLKEAEKGTYDPFVLVLEGAIPDEETAGSGFWCMMGEENGRVYTLNHWIDSLAERAAAAVAVGSCATFGGVPHGKPNPTGAHGLMEHLGKDWLSKLELPVINIPGCPPAGDWMTQAIGALVLAVRGLGPIPELDDLNRPTFLYGQLAHDNCPRAGFYSEGKFSETFGDENCVVSLGCKGLIANCPAPGGGWINRVGGCPTMGSPCLGCTEPEFPDEPFSPFLKPPEGVVMTTTVFKRVLGGLYEAYRLQKGGDAGG